MESGALTTDEIRSQPEVWRRAASRAAELSALLPPPGGRLAVVGCGTSYFMAQAFAAAREARGLGETDAFAASEMPAGRTYDGILAISRSGTTTEVARLIRARHGRQPIAAITAVPDTPVFEAADAVLLLDFADEQSVVQTRFATGTLAMLRAVLGEDVEPAAADAERALTLTPPATGPDHSHFVFLGCGWTVGIANEAALKMREAAGAWAESIRPWSTGTDRSASPGRAARSGPSARCPATSSGTSRPPAPPSCTTGSTRSPSWCWPSARPSPAPPPPAGTPTAPIS